MKSNFILGYLIFLISLDTFAQKVTHTLSIGENSRIKAIKSVPGKGFYIHTLNLVGIGIPGKEKSLTYLDNNLKEVWNIKPNASSSIICSAETPFVYQFATSYNYDYNGLGLAVVKPMEEWLTSINRINEKGIQDSFKIIFKETTKDVLFLAAGIDEDYLYYLSYLPDDKRIKKGFFYDKISQVLAPKKLFLRKIGHADKKFTEVEVNINFSEEGDLNYLGCSDGLIYIYQKVLYDTRHMEYKVFAISSDGEIEKSFSIQHKIPDYFAPLDFGREYNGGYSPVKNFERISNNHVGKYDNLPDEYYPLLYSMSTLEINFASGKIFLYGMSNKKKTAFDQRDGEIISGLYFNIYSLDGDLQNELYTDIGSRIEENKAFSRSQWSYLRSIHFEVLADDLYRINIGSRSSNFSSILMNDKRIISSHTNENNYNAYGELIIFDFPKEITYKSNLMAMEDEAPVSYVKYLQQHPPEQSKKVHYLAVNNGLSYVLIKYEKLKEEIKVTCMLFE